MATNKKVGTIQKPEPETFGIQCFYNLNVCDVKCYVKCDIECFECYVKCDVE